MSRYRKYPLKTTELPSGIPFIIANEAAERFSYYGMRAILVVFMTQYLVDASGEPDFMSEHEAQGYFHLFVSAVYLMPIVGALLADTVLGKYRTILFLSLFYCFGHMTLAIDDTRFGLLIGQALIAFGAGGIKPCVSSHLGDQFGKTNSYLITKVFGWFYFSINLGAFTSMLLIPWLLHNYGSSLAFGVPGIVMLSATIIFWSGRYRFVHIDPAGSGFIKDVLGDDGLKILGKLTSIYVFIAIFWSLFEQIGSSWVLQAQKMDRVIFGIEILPSQVQAANPLLIMFLVPCFSYGLYPLLGRYCRLTPLKKIGIGLFLTALAFSIPSLLQMQIDKGLTPFIGWQLFAFVLLTAAEVMVSITCLEFSYTQAPKSMKSFIMAYYFVFIAAGNLLTSAINFLILRPDGLSYFSGSTYFWFFTGLMLITTLLYLVVSRGYEEQTFLQDEQIT